MIDLDELEALHREGLRYPEGVEYDVARTAAFDALPALLRLARRARRLEEAAREAEGFIAGAMPYYAADRKQAIERVVPLLRAALAEGEG